MSRGRPKLPEGDAQDSILTVRLSKADRESVAATANAAGISVSDFARSVLLKQTPQKQPDAEWIFNYEGARIYLTTPCPISRVMWGRLRAYVEVIRPNKVQATEPDNA